MNELEKNADVTRLVGHSLSGSIIQEINSRLNNQKYSTTTYNSSFVAFENRGGKNPNHLRFRNTNDVISILDRDAIQVESGTLGPFKVHKDDNMKTQGTFEVGVDDGAQVQQQIQRQNRNT